MASLEYRTVGDGATYEDGLVDVRDAIACLGDHAAAWKVDVSRVVLWGESAGGYLAALAATRGVAGTSVMGVVDVVGASDLSRVADGFDEAAQRMWHAPDSSVSRYVGNPPPREANPLEFVDSSTPPFLLFAGDDDRIVSPRQSLILHRALTAAGGSSRRIVLAGAGHGELALRTSDTKVWTSKAVMNEIVGFMAARTGVADGFGEGLQADSGCTENESKDESARAHNRAKRAQLQPEPPPVPAREASCQGPCRRLTTTAE